MARVTASNDGSMGSVGAGAEGLASGGGAAVCPVGSSPAPRSVGGGSGAGGLGAAGDVGSSSSFMKAPMSRLAARATLA